MKDFFKHELKIGDYVIYINRHYREFEVGIVEGFTPMYVRLASVSEVTSKFLQEPSRLVRLTGIDLTLYLLKNNTNNTR
jgi:hypothetical protein